MFALEKLTHLCLSNCNEFRKHYFLPIWSSTILFKVLKSYPVHPIHCGKLVSGRMANFLLVFLCLGCYKCHPASNSPKTHMTGMLVTIWLSTQKVCKMRKRLLYQTSLVRNLVGASVDRNDHWHWLMLMRGGRSNLSDGKVPAPSPILDSGSHIILRNEFSTETF